MLRRSARIRRSRIPSGYVMYLQKFDYNVGTENDPKMFSQAISCRQLELWLNAMKDEVDSMVSNKVWALVKLPSSSKSIGCK